MHPQYQNRCSEKKKCRQEKYLFVPWGKTRRCCNIRKELTFFFFNILDVKFFRFFKFKLVFFFSLFQSFLVTYVASYSRVKVKRKWDASRAPNVHCVPRPLKKTFLVALSRMLSLYYCHAITQFLFLFDTKCCVCVDITYDSKQAVELQAITYRSSESFKMVVKRRKLTCS